MKLVVILVSILLPLLAPTVQGASTITVTIMTYPEKLPILVDNVIYTPGPGTTQYTFHWTPGEQHTVEILEETYYQAPGERLVFDAWNTGETGKTLTIAPTKNMSIIAIYREEVYLQLTTPYGTPTGSGWYPIGSQANLTIQRTIQLDNGTRAVFQYWTAGETPTRNKNTIRLFEPTSIKAVWQLQHMLHAETSTGLLLPITGWHNSGERIQIEAPTELPGPDGTIYRFSHWNLTSGKALIEDPTQRKTVLTLQGPATIVAVYDTFYRVTIMKGTGPPTTEYVKAGTTYEASITKTIINIGPGERLVFNGWSNGDHSPTTTILVNKPTTLTASWETQYLVTIKQGPVPTQGGGWYKAGTTATIRAPQTYNARLGAKYTFHQWTGTTSSPNNTLNLRIDGPITLEAIYNKSYKSLIIGILVSIATVTSLTLGIYKLKR